MNRSERNRRGWVRSILIASPLVAVFALSIVAWVWSDNGRSMAERALTAMAMPIGLLWLGSMVVAIASVLNSHKGLAVLFATIWLFIGITFNNRVATQLRYTMQFPVADNPENTSKERYDAVILLGGYASVNRFGVPELGGDGQRMLWAGQLWHAGRTRTMITTGTGPPQNGTPSEIGRKLLLSIGVPDDVIFEVPGDNTAAEMQNLKHFFDAPPEEWLTQISDSDDPQSVLLTEPPKIALVTSALHMNRAMRLAESEGLSLTPLPCLMGGPPGREFYAIDLIPTAGAGKNLAAAFKEWLAGLVGR